MKDNGFLVKSSQNKDLADFKETLGLPPGVWSCHTAIVNGYVVEGHVPIQVIEKLLAERPDIDGIALPGMPSGSPGMGGAKQEPWTIYAIRKGEVVGEFTRL